MNIEKIQSNWETYSSILARFQDGGINSLLESLGERLCIAPANPREEQYGCFPGGLISHQLGVLRLMKKVSEVHDCDFNAKSLYKVSLLHDIGRIGTDDMDWLKEQDSAWHRERGFHFKANFDLPELTHVQRTLYFLQKHKVSLTEEEHMAILSIEDNNPRNKLASLLLHTRAMLKNG